MQKTYLGDGVYAEYDGHYVTLSASDGLMNVKIHLDPDVQTALAQFFLRLVVPEPLDPPAAAADPNGLIDDPDDVEFVFGYRRKTAKNEGKGAPIDDCLL